MLRLAALLLARVLAAPLAAQETVVTGVSTDNIALNATFDGSELFVFGAIRRDAPVAARGRIRIDVIITIKGPPRTLRVRHKERRLGHLDEHRIARGAPGAELLRHRHHPTARATS